LVKSQLKFVNRNYELSKSQNQKYFTKLTDEFVNLEFRTHKQVEKRGWWDYF